MRERVATMLDTVTPAVLRLRRVTYPQKVCISVWTAPPCRSKGVMQAKTCVEVLDLSPGSRPPRRGALQADPRVVAGSIVAVTLLRPLFLLRYRAASATLSRRSGIFFSLAGTRSRPHSPKLAVTSILRVW